MKILVPVKRVIECKVNMSVRDAAEAKMPPMGERG